MERLTDQLKHLRKSKGWSQEALARNLGVSLNTVQRWEMGKNKPSQLAIEKIRALLHGVGEEAQLKLFNEESGLA
jgi:transcriptional regulator with XRE-family HTH domain